MSAICRSCSDVSGVRPSPRICAIWPANWLMFTVRGAEVHRFTGGDVPPRDVAALRFVVHELRVHRVLRALQAVSGKDREPVRHLELAVAAPRDAARGPVVLQAAAHAIRHLEVEADAVELPHREVVQAIVRAALVVRLEQSRIAGHDEVARVVRVDPHRVVVFVDAEHAGAPRIAAVVGEREIHRHAVQAIRVLRVDADL